MIHPLIYFRLQEKLLTEILTKHPEFFDAMRQCCRNVLQHSDGGILDLTLDELSAQMIPTGDQAIPEDFRVAFVAHIQSSLQKVSSQRR